MNGTIPITQIYDHRLKKCADGVKAANPVNHYFCKISTELSEKFAGSDMYNCSTTQKVRCDSVDQISVRRAEELINRIDLQKSSGISGVPTKLLKLALQRLPEIFTALLSLCLATSIFPDKWKLALVVCLPKGGNITDPGNIHPIFLIPICRTILESFINDRLTSFLESNNLFCSSQYGFRCSA